MFNQYICTCVHLKLGKPGLCLFNQYICTSVHVWLGNQYICTCVHVEPGHVDLKVLSIFQKAVQFDPLYIIL